MYFSNGLYTIEHTGYFHVQARRKDVAVIDQATVNAAINMPGVVTITGKGRLSGSYPSAGLRRHRYQHSA